MPPVLDHAHVGHTAAQCFDLVADVERYPEFVPLWQAAQGASAYTRAGGIEVLVATYGRYKLISETFTSRVTLDRPQSADPGRIFEGTVQPARKSLELFHPTGERTCEVEFFLFLTNVRSRALALLIGTMFDRRFRRFAVAFERGARSGRQKSRDCEGLADQLVGGRHVGDQHLDAFRLGYTLTHLEPPASGTNSG